MGGIWVYKLPTDLVDIDATDRISK
jgi:hypothetical protein